MFISSKSRKIQTSRWSIDLGGHGCWLYPLIFDRWIFVPETYRPGHSLGPILGSGLKRDVIHPARKLIRGRQRDD